MEKRRKEFGAIVLRLDAFFQIIIIMFSNAHMTKLQYFYEKTSISACLFRQ